MFGNLKKRWRALKKSHPGRRFQDRHEQRKNRSGLWKAFYLVAGTALCLIGIVLMPAPGPGFLVVFVGGALLAEESLLAARALDWLELKGRALLARVKHGLRPRSPRHGTGRSSR